MPVHVQSGPADVVGSGTTTTFFGHPLVLTAEVDAHRAVVEICFETTGTDGPVRLHSEPRPDGWRLVVTDLTGPDGRGTAEPMLVGDLGGTLLWLHLRAFRFGRTDDHTVAWTLFRADAHDVGYEPTPADDDATAPHDTHQEP